MLYFHRSPRPAASRTARVRVLLAAAAAWACIGCGSSAFAAATLNLDTALADTKAVLNGGGQANILVLADSLSFYPGNWLTYFRQSMQAQYGDAGHGYQAFSPDTNAVFSDGWLLGKRKFDIEPHWDMEGLWGHAETAGLSATWNLVGPAIEMRYVAGPGRGRVNIRDADGALIAELDTAAAVDHVATWTYQFPAGATQSLQFETLDDAPLTILGANNTLADPDAAGVQIHRAANVSWGINRFRNRNWSLEEQLQILSPDLIVLWIGGNDVSQYAGNLPLYQQRVGGFIDRVSLAVPDAEWLLVGTKRKEADRGLIVEAMEQVALSRGLGWLNIHDIAGDQVFYEANNFLFDGAHFSQPGGEYVGGIVFDAFVNEGAGLVEGVVGDYNGDGLVNTEDINPFIAALTGDSADVLYGDINWDEAINTEDINGFIALLTGGGGGGGAIIPEPATVTLLMLGGVMLRRRGVRTDASLAGAAGGSDIFTALPARPFLR